MESRIELCGTMAVRIAGQDVTARLPTGQAQLLFAYLVLERERELTREELVEAVWSEHVPPAAAPALRALLSRVRAAIGADHVAGRVALRLDLPDAWVDVEAASSSVAAGRTAAGEGRWTEALGESRAAAAILARPLLPSLSAPWLDERRRELEALRVSALEQVARAGLALGSGPDLAEAETAAAALVAAAPLHEAGHCCLMEVRAARGNVPEALLAYEDLRRVLRDELGVPPGAAAQRLHRALLEGRAESPDRAAPLPRTLATAARGPWVGRERLLAALEDGLDEALAGRRPVALLAGEAGAGKTRLAAELGVRAHARGMAVLYGRCEDRPVAPYEPFVEVIGNALAGVSDDRLATVSGATLAEVARISPHLGRRRGVEAAAGAGERHRLFDAVDDLLAALAEPAGALLVVDDLQWAEAPTLLLLRHLARAPGPGRLLVVAGYREGDEPRALRDLLSSLRREGLAEPLRLEGLSEAEVAELVGIWGGDRNPAQLAGPLHRHTAGNPLFVVETLRHLDSLELSDVAPLAALGVPPAVKDVLARRFDALGEPARTVLRAAAVIGQSFDAATLARAADVDGEVLLGILDQAREARLIIETEDPGTYAFSHVLVAETLEEELGALRRARLHARVAGVVEDRPAARLAEVARHLLAAGPEGDPVRAVEFARRAAAEANALLAYEEAAGLTAAALDALRHAGGDGALRCELLLEHGDSLRRSGAFEPARETFAEALSCARASGDVRQLGHAALGLGAGPAPFAPRPTDPVVVDALREALAALPAADAPLRARLLARLAMELALAPGRAERAALAAEAEQLARASGDPDVLAAALGARHLADWGPENSSERLGLASEIVAIGTATGDREAALRGHMWRFIDHLELADATAAAADLQAYEGLAAELRQPGYAWWSAVLTAMRDVIAGDFDGAEAASRRALALAPSAEEPVASQFFTAQMAAVLKERGRLHELAPAVADIVGQAPENPAWSCLLAYMRAQAGERETLQPDLAPLAAELPCDGLWLLGSTLLADACALVEDAALATELHAALLPHAGRCVVALGGVWFGPVDHHLALLAATTGAHEEADNHFEQATAISERMGAQPWAAHSRREHAAMLLRGGEPGNQERAGALLDQTLDTASRLGMSDLEALALALRDGVPSPR